MGKITTHILDTASGKPAANIQIILYRSDSGEILNSTITNEDGRCDAAILAGKKLTKGRYRLEFHVGDYFATSDEIAFLDMVPVEFGVTDEAAHYHIPLLISPFGYSTYRGS